jgi:hypothetical protein
MKNILVLTLALALSLSFAACRKNSDNGGNSTTSALNTDEVYAIPKDKIRAVSWATDSEKEAVIAEIPAEMFKAIGELSHCTVMKSGALPGYKYSLAIVTTNKDGNADLEKLVDYYRSIGGTVEKTNSLLNDYDVKFDYAESVSVDGMSSSIQVQFSVVKE